MRLPVTLPFLSGARHPTASAASPKPTSPLTLAWLGALWLGLLCNWPLWQRLHQLPELASPQGKLFLAAFAVMVTALLGMLLSLLAWRRCIKPVLLVLMLTAAPLAHFMGSYGIVMDGGMLTNLLQTDVNEARDLLGPRLLLSLLLLAGLPLIWMLGRPLTAAPFWRRAGLNLLAAALGLALALLAASLTFGDLVSTMRSHKSLRYMVNPLNALYAVGHGLHAQTGSPPGPLQPLGEDARWLQRPGKPPLLLLVVGETARSANFSLNGYARPTNPLLARQSDLLSFRDVSACGTSTAASLPCMFSPLGRDAFLAQKQPQENLLDMLQRAGLAVLWLDNQAGCKEVCNRVPTLFAETAAPGAAPLPEGLCRDGECLDGALLHGLDQRLAELDPARAAKGVVLVMHQMGSHGPAYYKRSPAELKPFQPECRSTALQQCPREQVVNGYDNTIAYTDRVLSGAIDWLRTRQHDYAPAMLYVSDHGESLGENNVYLHGMPYAMAPHEQTHVPAILWLPPETAAAQGVKPGCLAGRLDQPLTHDLLAHTVMGYSGVTSKLYRPEWDLLQPCRG
ncbi:phosphoethanolamine--lipid A transferase [Roseateles sp. DAIF2]|uniref:phosphoethanolamine transferase n=1 Tax=Roseateles sp. DAIF2 TaxID=2714952 RepID=UPI0018A33850|nr:phosphoethanolamine--lipid A transferase [Roseateles sp. DAIF2]QPF74866.1 phosphoethanolamine--lipid A transferase [Roseateles sp. DAIF2]